MDCINHFSCNCTVGFTGDHCEAGELTAGLLLLLLSLLFIFKMRFFRVVILVMKLNIARNLQLNWKMFLFF